MRRLISPLGPHNRSLHRGIEQASSTVQLRVPNPSNSGCGIAAGSGTDARLPHVRTGAAHFHSHYPVLLSRVCRHTQSTAAVTVPASRSISIGTQQRGTHGLSRRGHRSLPADARRLPRHSSRTPEHVSFDFRTHCDNVPGFLAIAHDARAATRPTRQSTVLRRCRPPSGGGLILPRPLPAAAASTPAAAARAAGGARRAEHLSIGCGGDG